MDDYKEVNGRHVGPASNDAAFVDQSAIDQRHLAIIEAITGDKALHEALLRHARVKLRITHAKQHFDIMEMRRVSDLVDMAAIELARNQLYAEQALPKADEALLRDITKLMDIVIEVEAQQRGAGGGRV